jgi:hypothetical protein
MTAMQIAKSNVWEGCGSERVSAMRTVAVEKGGLEGGVGGAEDDCVVGGAGVRVVVKFEFEFDVELGIFWPSFVSPSQPGPSLLTPSLCVLS